MRANEMSRLATATLRSDIATGMKIGSLPRLRSAARVSLPRHSPFGVAILGREYWGD
jgi:hypothetical protein